MNFEPPLHIQIISDGSLLEFVGSKASVYTYKYIRSATKKNKVLYLKEEQLINLIETQKTLNHGKEKITTEKEISATKEIIIEIGGQARGKTAKTKAWVEEKLKDERKGQTSTSKAGKEQIWKDDRGSKKRQTGSQQGSFW